jgi:hypothetical protein
MLLFGPLRHSYYCAGSLVAFGAKRALSRIYEYAA